jgi:hypothetical protein
MQRMEMGSNGTTVRQRELRQRAGEKRVLLIGFRVGPDLAQLGGGVDPGTVGRYHQTAKEINVMPQMTLQDMERLLREPMFAVRAAALEIIVGFKKKDWEAFLLNFLLHLVNESPKYFNDYTFEMIVQDTFGQFFHRYAKAEVGILSILVDGQPFGISTYAAESSTRTPSLNARPA